MNLPVNSVSHNEGRLYHSIQTLHYLVRPFKSAGYKYVATCTLIQCHTESETLLGSPQSRMELSEDLDTVSWQGP
jgi:hypothetical protein